MTDVIIIPTYFRPEYLALCLDHIGACSGWVSKEIWICQDWHESDHERFAVEWAETKSIFREVSRFMMPRLKMFVRPVNSYYGNSCNVLSAYKRALLTGAELIYLIEDDVLVTPDFFKWHEDAQRDETIFCSVAGHAEETSFASLGVCWRRENLAPIVEHARPEYYVCPDQYLKKHFPDSMFGVQFVEQDGLIRRIIERDKKVVRFAEPPRAFHTGVFGYHRSIGPEAMVGAGLYGVPLETKIANLRRLVRDQKWMNQVAGDQTDLQAYPS